MGCFNFDCCVCGEGTHRDEEDGMWNGREYFGAPVRIKVPTKKGGTVILEGEYTGYGEVEVKFGGKLHEFYPKQFDQYWDYWDTAKQYIAHEVYCEDCMEDVPLTSRATFDLTDFILAVDYMAVNPKPSNSFGYREERGSLWDTKPVAPAPPVKSAPVKVPKPKAPTKEELVKQVAEMKAELERLRPLEARFKRL